MIQNEPEVKHASRVTIGISMPISLYNKLKSAAIVEKRSLSNKAMQIVAEYFTET